MIKKIILPLVVTMLTTSLAQAMTKKEVGILLKDKVPFIIKSVEDSPLIGFYQIVTDKGLVYVDHKGEHLITGNIFSVKGGLKNLTDIRKQKLNKERFAEYKETAITYKAKNEQFKVTVFTDISCGYCQKLHEQVPEYNKLGITISFLAWPRNGLDSSIFKKMETVWCEKDQLSALDKASKNAYEVDEDATCTNPVEAHYNFGKILGIKGTPAVYSEGRKLSAYLPPNEMLQKLNATLKN